MGEVTAPVYSEEINLKIPDRVSINLLLSERMLLYPLCLNFCNSEFHHITTCYVLY